MRTHIGSLVFKFLGLLPGILFLSSCGNGNGDPQAAVSNDTTPPDIRAINEKINSDRNNPDLYFQRAKADLSHKYFENAIADMNIALKIDSTKTAYHIFLSDLYFTQNNTRGTRDALRKAMALDSSNAEALMKYSQLFYLLKKFDTATFYINRSLHYNNASAVAHYQKGMILTEWGDTAKAVLSFQDAVQRDQKYYDAYLHLGILLSKKGNPLALGYFDNALAVDPKSIEALYGKGRMLQKMGDYDNALKAYNALLSLEAQHPDANYNVGAILFEQKKYDEALQKFDELILRDENFYRGYYGKGRCYEAKGEKQKAITAYKKCLSIKPDYDLAALQLDMIDRKVRLKAQ